VVRRWLEVGVDVNMVDDGEDTLLDHAIYNRDLEIVELLIEKNICINRSVNGHSTPLQLAASCLWLDMVCLLIHSGADVFARHADGETLLMRAARWGNEGVVLALISAGVDPEA
ncbi:ankyrin repeat protein, partial [Baffinella frigidus]